MILRISQKLRKKIGAETLSTQPLNRNPYADWSCHQFTEGRTQYIIMSNTKSLYSCVMHGRGITSESRFIERAMTAIREFMEADGQAFVYQRFIIPDCDTISFGKALNRSVTGSMNELIGTAQVCLADGYMTPYEVGFKLNNILLSALDTAESPGYEKPNRAFKKLADDIAV